MGYTVQGLTKPAGISPRALRYYDEIGLLKPATNNTSGIVSTVKQRLTGCNK